MEALVTCLVGNPSARAVTVRPEFRWRILEESAYEVVPSLSQRCLAVAAAAVEQGPAAARWAGLEASCFVRWREVERGRERERGGEMKNKNKKNVSPFFSFSFRFVPRKRIN